MIKKYVYFFILLAILAVFACLLFSRSQNIPQALIWQSGKENCAFLDFWCERKEVRYGVYDYEGTLKGETGLAVDHYYFSWINFDAFDFQAKAEESKQRNRSLFITLEPWAREPARKEKIFTDITLGRYDADIKKVCTEFGKVSGKVEVSFAHEMDHDLTVRYDWSGGKPAEFVGAYKHFVSECRKLAENTSYVWSPAGDGKALEYWPGDEYVDSVGFPVYSFPDFDVLYYGHARSFKESVQEKYSRLSPLMKPLYIVELGVAGDYARKSAWIEDMYSDIDEFPLIKTILFFNAVDHEGVWGADLPAPDWRVDGNLIRQ